MCIGLSDEMLFGVMIELLIDDSLVMCVVFDGF